MTVRLLQVEPTTRCNYTCGFCAGRHLDQSDLPLDTFDALLGQLPELEHLELQGEGEPLMHPDFFAMARRARDRGVEVSTITNGSFFSDARIEQLFAADVGSILVSLESADAEAFAAIRGGRLDKVIAGLQRLLAGKRRTGRGRPHVGFAVTVLSDTRDQLGPILDLYESLGMDGGVLVHFLSDMEVYAATYDPVSASRVLGPVQQALAWSRAERLLGDRDLSSSEALHFWSVMVARAARDRDGRGGYRSCPWLDQGLFMDRNGQLTACPNVKDPARFGWGQVSETNLTTVLAHRARMQARLSAGDIPEACRGCFIATSVARRVAATTSEDLDG